MAQKEEERRAIRSGGKKSRASSRGEERRGRPGRRRRSGDVEIEGGGAMYAQKFGRSAIAGGSVRKREVCAGRRVWSQPPGVGWRAAASSVAKRSDLSTKWSAAASKRTKDRGAKKSGSPSSVLSWMPERTTTGQAWLRFPGMSLQSLSKAARETTSARREASSPRSSSAALTQSLHSSIWASSGSAWKGTFEVAHLSEATAAPQQVELRPDWLARETAFVSPRRSTPA
mmetsp:Transcript_4043/g.12409  ORF Transcript_4043/g.12409 Transcript_4043/m.12409 type:complete len:229 (+) Transcript_4043:231-917(+)